MQASTIRILTGHVQSQGKTVSSFQRRGLVALFIFLDVVVGPDFALLLLLLSLLLYFLLLLLYGQIFIASVQFCDPIYFRRLNFHTIGKFSRSHPISRNLTHPFYCPPP